MKTEREARAEAYDQLLNYLDVNALEGLVEGHLRLCYPELDEDELDDFLDKVLDEMHAPLREFSDQIMRKQFAEAAAEKDEPTE